jgi:LPS O-antigen subunit length determinant protein (WzzB/FepE family)
MSGNTNEMAIKHSEGLDFIDLALLLWQGGKIILTTILFFALLGFALVSFLPTKYTGSLRIHSLSEYQLAKFSF